MEHAIADDEDVFGAAFGDEAFGVEHQRLGAHYRLSRATLGLDITAFASVKLSRHDEKALLEFERAVDDRGGRRRSDGSDRRCAGRALSRGGPAGATPDE